MLNKKLFIQFLVMVLVGCFFNPMNILIYKLSHFYLSKTLFYGGVLMASNMIWAHEIVHYLNMNSFNFRIFILGIIMSVFVSLFLLRGQYSVGDNQWLKRMIGHHSTALTTTHKIINRTKNPKIKKLGKNIINTQKKEIKLMKSYLN